MISDANYYLLEPGEDLRVRKPMSPAAQGEHGGSWPDPDRPGHFIKSHVSHTRRIDLTPADPLEFVDVLRNHEGGLIEVVVHHPQSAARLHIRPQNLRVVGRSLEQRRVDLQAASDEASAEQERLRASMTSEQWAHHERLERRLADAHDKRRVSYHLGVAALACGVLTWVSVVALLPLVWLGFQIKGKYAGDGRNAARRDQLAYLGAAFAVARLLLPVVSR